MTKTAKTILWVVIVVIVIVIIAVSRGSSSKETGPIKIGFIGPLTGDVGELGQNAKAAVEIATDEVNKSGGINGRKIEVIYEDGKCTGASASSAASKLINVDNVAVILGGACSGETMAFTQLAESSKTPVLSYCSSNPAITTAGDYIFRNYPSDTYQGSFAANYLYKNINKKNIALVYSKTDWSIGIKDVFVSEFEKLGGRITSQNGFEPAVRDLKTILSKVKNENPDAVYYLAYTDQTIPGLQQASQIGLKVTMFGGDAWDDAKIWSSLGAAGEGAMYAVVSSKESESFKTAMAAKIGSNNLGPCSPTAYDGIKILSQVIGQVGSNREAIKTGLYNAVYTGGVSSDEVRFDQNGDLVGANYTIKQVHNGVAGAIK